MGIDANTQPSKGRVAKYTIFVCPECAFWNGGAEGLWSKPHRCPRCIRRSVEKNPHRLRKFTTMTNINSAPMMEPRVLVALDEERA